MAWKPKEKPLTPEEAIEFAKTELAPWWFGSSPLLAGVRNENRVTALPLNPSFTKKNWLIFFLDPTDFTGEATLHYAREWHKRYRVHGLETLLIYQVPYQFLKQNETMKKMIDRLQIPFVVAIDAEGLLSTAFSVKELPGVLLTHDRKTLLQKTGANWLDGTEAALQDYLRSRDPGLPLFPVYQPVHPLADDIGRVEFGSSPKKGAPMRFPPPGFTATGSGAKVGDFPFRDDLKLLPGEISIGGLWFQEEDRIFTSDEHATILLHCPSPKLSLVAQTLSKTTDPSRIIFEIGIAPAYDAVAGSDLVLDENGQSFLKVTYEKLYHALVKLPENERMLTLKFPSAATEPVSIYGLRFGK